MPGTLYVVATPIGNLQDLSPRAVATLAAVDVIACEDTRQTGKLLAAHVLKTPMISLHDHNERQRAPELLERLQRGESIALVSDGGTPLISDPGWRVVHDAAARQVPVVAIPGPTALIGALVVSGLPTDRFAFEGFLPVKAGARRRRLEALREESRTIVAYESPHRLLKTLADIRDVLGDAPVSCSRELTKVHEETRRGTAAELLAHFEAHPPRGEFVLVIGAQRLAASEDDESASE